MSNYIVTPTHLQKGYQGASEVSYDNLMKSSTRLNSNRYQYVPMRMVNNVYGKEINRELQHGYKVYN